VVVVVFSVSQSKTKEARRRTIEVYIKEKHNYK
jgi:hypothetical protein